MTGIVSISGEVSLLYEDTDHTGGDVLLISLDPDEVLAFNTFEVHGDLATRYKAGVLEEGMRVRVDCRSETIEVIDFGTGETRDEERPVVVDLVILDDAP